VNLSDGILVAAVLTAGGALEGLRQARVSLREQGRRLGAVEKWQEREDGRREGRSEAREVQHRERSG
jgi:hypothetical protein